MFQVHSRPPKRGRGSIVAGAFLLVLLPLVPIPALGFPSCTCPDPGPVDLPGCDCYVDGGGDWPLVPILGDMPGTAARSVGAKSSCFLHRGQPYWQVQRHYGTDFLARVIGILFPETTSDWPAQAWCTETIAFWAFKARVPYPSGYWTIWHHMSSFVESTQELREWYQTEEGLPALLGPRAHWVDGSELDYADFEPGVNGPCPGAYQQQEAWNDTLRSWRGSGKSHSQLVDSLLVYRWGNPAGPVTRIDVWVSEGNSGGTNLEQCDPDLGKPHHTASDDSIFAQSRIRNDRSYPNIIDLTVLGDGWIGTSFPAKKIRGWGVHTEGGVPTYDPSRIRTIVTPAFIGYPAPTGVDTSGASRVTRVVNWATATQGQFVVGSNSPLVQTGSALPGATTPWRIPAGAHPVNPVRIDVDLLVEHPVPVRGLTLEWKNGKIPPYFEIWWAGANGQPLVRATTKGTGPTIPAEIVPLPVAFHGVFPVRYARLSIPATALTQTYEIVGFHLNFANGDPEDDNDVFRDDDPPPTASGPPFVPAALALRPSIPNPFNPRTELVYSLPRAGHVRLSVHDVRGRVVAVLVDQNRDAGEHRIVWDALAPDRRSLSSGIYFAKLVSGGEVRTQKLVLVR